MKECLHFNSRDDFITMRLMDKLIVGALAVWLAGREVRDLKRRREDRRRREVLAKHEPLLKFFRESLPYF